MSVSSTMKITVLSFSEICWNVVQSWLIENPVSQRGMSVWNTASADRLQSHLVNALSKTSISNLCRNLHYTQVLYYKILAWHKGIVQLDKYIKILFYVNCSHRKSSILKRYTVYLLYTLLKSKTNYVKHYKRVVPTEIRM